MIRPEAYIESLKPNFTLALKEGREDVCEFTFEMLYQLMQGYVDYCEKEWEKEQHYERKAERAHQEYLEERDKP